MSDEVVDYLDLIAIAAKKEQKPLKSALLHWTV